MIKQYAQTQAYERLQAFINTLRPRGVKISLDILSRAWELYENMDSLIQKRGYILSVPCAFPGTDNDFVFDWSKKEQFFRCEIFGNGNIKFSYKKEEYLWIKETTTDSPLSEEVLDKLLLFVD